MRFINMNLINMKFMNNNKNYEIWDNGHDTLGEMLDEETTDKIMLESENYILGK